MTVVYDDEAVTLRGAYLNIVVLQLHTITES